LSIYTNILVYIHIAHENNFLKIENTMWTIYRICRILFFNNYIN